MPQTWQMIDYLATDYAGAVKNGAVLSASEYAEMREFTATVHRRLQALPPTPGTPALLSQADQLIASVDAKASPAQVAIEAHALADALLKAYPIPTAPAQAPDLTQGATLYQNQCAMCHGATGHGDGPVGLQLNPRPVDFTDQARADQRSPLSLYEVISHGVEGTPSGQLLVPAVVGRAMGTRVLRGVASLIPAKPRPVRPSGSTIRPRVRRSRT
ncbi:c-type cytochrome [Rhodanobacter sp. 115]|uniref:c-type cytochrome n=1 Tax=Rhodanobacter sp. FW021-MT20 TaxID=1162282 RepID=UPI0002D9E7E1|nr:c-type cytochrome [Rhodanobacter sp. 115]